MENIITSNWFIFVSELANILIVVLVIIALVLAVKILYHLKTISKLAEAEVKNIVEDIGEAREDLVDGIKITKKQLKIIATALTAKKMVNFLAHGVSQIIKKESKKSKK